MKQITKNEMLIKPGGIWYLQTKNKQKQRKKGKQWNLFFSV